MFTVVVVFVVVVLLLFFPGNPEEGELRPQLLDRFGMHAQIGTVKDPELRVQIVSERSTFDENPAEFHKKYADKQVGRQGLG